MKKNKCGYRLLFHQEKTPTKETQTPEVVGEPAPGPGLPHEQELAENQPSMPVEESQPPDIGGIPGEAFKQYVQAFLSGNLAELQLERRSGAAPEAGEEQQAVQAPDGQGQEEDGGGSVGDEELPFPAEETGE